IDVGPVSRQSTPAHLLFIKLTGVKESVSDQYWVVEPTTQAMTISDEIFTFPDERRRQLVWYALARQSAEVPVNLTLAKKRMFAQQLEQLFRVKIDLNQITAAQRGFATRIFYEGLMVSVMPGVEEKHEETARNIFGDEQSIMWGLDGMKEYYPRALTIITRRLLSQISNLELQSDDSYERAYSEFVTNLQGLTIGEIHDSTTGSDSRSPNFEIAFIQLLVRALNSNHSLPEIMSLLREGDIQKLSSTVTHIITRSGNTTMRPEEVPQKVIRGALFRFIDADGRTFFTPKSFLDA
ncbi:hypothetical protein HY357_00860, partial [Candidatus Roizmanbacteria bacterium]|nr:hypothetical protein [Candidatus Roizmanbacteria bacterium]